MMLRGVAIGGPHDTIMLEAGRHWLGTLEKHPDGRYTWDALQTSWVWIHIDRHSLKIAGGLPMARKSAHMLKIGMTVLIDGHSQKITDLSRDDEHQFMVITCGENVYRRTFGIKVDVISQHRA